LYEILGIKKNNFNFIGIRPGEKINETLISYEESRLTKNFKNFFILYNNLMNEKYMNFFEKGTKSKLFNYSSEMKNNLISGKKLINLISKTINQNIDET
jgi:FlaA1/EpsC-like NDP-sugar epimerase